MIRCHLCGHVGPLCTDPAMAKMLAEAEGFRLVNWARWTITVQCWQCKRCLDMYRRENLPIVEVK